MITLQEEPWSLVWPELEPMWAAHWEETEAGDGIDLDVNVQAFMDMAWKGQLQVITARDDGKAIGYHVTIVIPSLHNKSTLMGYVDGYFIDLDYRKGTTAIKLFREAEKGLKAKGVAKVFGATKLKKDMSRLFEFLGWTEAERSWSKILGRA